MPFGHNVFLLNSIFWWAIMPLNVVNNFYPNYLRNAEINHSYLLLNAMCLVLTNLSVILLNYVLVTLCYKCLISSTYILKKWDLNCRFWCQECLDHGSALFLFYFKTTIRSSLAKLPHWVYLPSCHEQLSLDNTNKRALLALLTI